MKPFDARTTGGRLSTRLALTAAAVLCLFVQALLATPASALEVTRLSAQPNADTGSDVVGGIDTRLTWEVQAAEDEVVSGLTLTFPEGSSYTTEDARLTFLSGQDLMDRSFPRCTFTADGQTLAIRLQEPAPAGVYVRVEVYGVQFPAAGGDITIEGGYTLASGQTHEVDGMGAIAVRGTSIVDRLAASLESQPWVQAWNANRFLRLFANPVLIVTSLPIIFSGFLMALAIVLVAFPLAIPVGFGLSLMRISKLKVLRALASVYVNLIRGTPAFLQIYIAFFGLPLAGVNLGNYPLGVIVMAMNSAAYLCEIFRAGIQSIPTGQGEAARSLGMTGMQTMVSIIIPQTFRNVIPTLTSEFILLFKDTSLLAAVGVMEIVMYAKTIVATTGSITPYVVAAFFYLLVTLPLAGFVSRLEARLHGADTGRIPSDSDDEDGHEDKAQDHADLALAGKDAS
ncbi:amino acid ABC transporter permease [Collinsella sp. AGMB00827]|uniref:Amino acid ABC transporter permease n=1 Tax=Collinsella ureilytica TaxID=2869515 RepID=A0ABS7MMK9_9ACTN|nr:amino acid ABC transporter permease [Collinsella urealyticum]MBY4798310.1 amino acid ABC transporter permease [Collinsella urealyticum]